MSSFQPGGPVIQTSSSPTGHLSLGPGPVLTNTTLTESTVGSATGVGATGSSATGSPATSSTGSAGTSGAMGMKVDLGVVGLVACVVGVVLM